MGHEARRHRIRRAARGYRKQALGQTQHLSGPRLSGPQKEHVLVAVTELRHAGKRLTEIIRYAARQLDFHRAARRSFEGLAHLDPVVRVDYWPTRSRRGTQNLAPHDSRGLGDHVVQTQPLQGRRRERYRAVSQDQRIGEERLHGLGKCSSHTNQFG